MKEFEGYWHEDEHTPFTSSAVATSGHNIVLTDEVLPRCACGYSPNGSTVEQLWRDTFRHTGYAVVELPALETVLPTLDKIAGLRYYLGTDTGFRIAAALLSAHFGDE